MSTDKVKRHQSKTILVTGATGKQGGAAVEHLRQRGFSIRAITRRPDQDAARKLVDRGVEVLAGDLDDLDSLRRALDGVYGVFGVITPYDKGGVEGEIRQGKNLVDAAHRQEVSHFVYSSVGGAEKNTGIPHFDSKFQIEEHLRRSGIPFSILRPVAFFENWYFVKDSIERGTLLQPLSPQRKLQQIGVDDIGAFAALAFEHPGKWHGRALEIAGDELTMEQYAAAFTNAPSPQVKYQQVPWDQFEQQSGHEVAVMYKWFEDVGYSADIDALRTEFPPLMSFPLWLGKSGWNRKV